MLDAVAVTGGASGLGAAVVRAVRDAGGNATAIDVAAPASGESDFVRADVGDGADVGAAITTAARRHGSLGALVCCAGIDACGPFDAVPADRWERVISVNLLGVANAVRSALPLLEHRKGRVAIVASTLGLRALPEATAYCASKFGVIGFARALAAETAGRVGVTLVIPGGMRTPFFDGRDERYKPAPDAALNDPYDVARAIVYALAQPPGCEIRELVICPSTEASWP